MKDGKRCADDCLESLGTRAEQGEEPALAGAPSSRTLAWLPPPVPPPPSADVSWLGDPTPYLDQHPTADWFMSTDCLSAQVRRGVVRRWRCTHPAGQSAACRSL